MYSFTILNQQIDMKANELMIGDLVFPDYNGFVLKILGNERYAEKAVKVHCKLCGGLEGYCDICPEPDKIRQLMKEDKI